MTYTRYIPDIYQTYENQCHMSGIYLSYTLFITFLQVPDASTSARQDIVCLPTMSYVHPTTSYVRRTMSCLTSHIRYRTYDITYDIVHMTFKLYVCQHPSGTLRYMISYMISEDNDIDYDIIGFEMSMIS